jgi:thiamine-phosphate pyrophosphorylase
VTPPLICLITGDRGREQPTLELIAAAVRGGVELIQIRERHFDDRALAALARRGVDLARASASRIIINDRADIALSTGASGVHLRGSSFAADRLRALAPPGFLMGRSVHTLSEATAAEAGGGCDYLLFGTVFPSSSKPSNHAIAGLEALRAVCGAVRLPVLAVGGISVETARQAADAGASGIAGISVFETARSMSAVVSTLRRQFDT